MSEVLANPVKNIFSRSAAKVLNACARFAYNFSWGFGIKLTKSAGSVAVGIDTDNELFKEWLRCVTRESIKSQTEIDVSGMMANDFDERYDTPPIPPPIMPDGKEGEYLWQSMTKDKNNSTATQTYYRGYKENSVIAIEDKDGSHKLWWVEKKYTPDGKLKSVSKLKGVTIIGA